MRIRTLVTPFVLTFLLGVLAVLVPPPASAACTNFCGCCNCWMKYYTYPPCSCSGENGCPTCSCNSDLEQFSAFTVKDMRMKTASFNIGDPTFPFAKSEIIQPGMELRMNRQCFRAKVALSLLESALDGLKLRAVRLGGKSAQDQNLVFQATLTR
jgi:hypothetical protein